MYGSRARSSRASAAEIFAICISDSVPSIMRAPPEHETMITAARRSNRELDAADDLLAHDDAHRAADEAVSIEQMTVSRPSRRPTPTMTASDLPVAAMVFARAILVRLGVGERERIVRAAGSGASLFPALVVEQRLQPGGRVNPEVMPAFVADVKVLDEILRVDDGVALRTLLPQPLGHAAGFLGPGQRFAGLLEPSHGNSLAIQSSKCKIRAVARVLHFRAM